MKILIVEDDFTSRKVLHSFLAPYGKTDIAVNGKEAVEAFRAAHAEGAPYHLVCLDLMMPEMDGHSTLKEIRRIEDVMNIRENVKIVITTCLKDSKNIVEAFKSQCEAYLVKPIDRKQLVDTLKRLDLFRAVVPSRAQIRGASAGTGPSPLSKGGE